MKRILTFNWHEGYISLLGKLPGVALSIVERNKGGYSRWMHEFRPCPRGSRLLSMSEALTELRAERFDAVIAHDPTDLLSTMESPIPQILILHNRLDTMIELGGNAVDRKGYLEWFSNLVRMVPDLEVVYISEAKKENWGIEGKVILPGVDGREWGPYEGSRATVLRVGNFLRERDLMLGHRFSEEAVKELSQTVIGINPGVSGARMSRNQGDLRTLYRESRVYLHSTVFPYEDGYNFALLEAMASGMPIAALSHPASPVVNGRSGYLSNQPEELRERIVELLDHPEKARRMGEAARQDILETFSFDRFVERWSELLERKTRAWGSARKFREERGEVIERIPAGASTILDVGCGRGYLGRGVRERMGDVTLIGLESNPEKAREAMSFYDRVIVDDAVSWTPDLLKESVDVLIFADILEHVEDPKALLGRYLSLLSPAGIILLSIPNIRYHKVIKGLAEGHFQYEEDGILDRSHLRFFTRESMLDLISSAGLWVESISANVDSRYRWVREGTDLSEGKKTDIDLGSLVIRDQDDEGVRDLFSIQYLFTARRKIQAILDRVDRLSGEGGDLNLVSVLLEARLDDSLSREEQAEIDLKIGEIASKNREFTEARSAYERAMEILALDRDERPVLGLGVVDLLTGCPDQSLLWFKMAFDLNPASWKALSGFGMACQELERAEEAFYYYGQSLEMEMDQEEILRMYVDLGRSLGQYERPVSPLRRFLEKNPSNVEVRIMLAEVLVESRLLEEASRELDRIPMKEKENVRIHLLRDRIASVHRGAAQRVS
ncbi:MAG: methyltransferase domain-containing protein [Leptospirales bacterium]